MTDEIRVLVLNCEFPPIGGGSATATEYFLKELERLPVHATLVTAAVEGGEGRRKFGKHSNIDFLAVGKKDIHYWTTLELARYAWAAYRHIGRLERAGERFDLCHAFFTLPAGGVAMAKSASRPYIVYLQGSDVPGYSERFSWLYRTSGFAFRRIWEKASAVVANSADLAALARETASDVPFEIIPNGIDIESFQPGGTRSNGVTVLTVARLVPRKGVSTVIRAAAILNREFSGVRLVIVGDGPLAGELEKLARSEGIADVVELRRSVPREDMPSVYREADVFVLMSQREGMSNTVLEALASGLPVVATSDALTGIDAPGAAVVPADNAAAAAGAIGTILGDNILRARAAGESRRAAEKYSWGAMAESHLDLYRRVLASARNRRP